MLAAIRPTAFRSLNGFSVAGRSQRDCASKRFLIPLSEHEYAWGDRGGTLLFWGRSSRLLEARAKEVVE